MSEILVEETNGVAWVTINRPEVRNALSRELNLKLQDIAVGFDGREGSVRAVVITGAGDKAFSAGADLKERKGVPAAETAPFLNAISGAIQSWGEIRQPTLCLMNGSAFGGGLELAMACDFRVIVDGAEVALTEVQLGIMPGAGGTQRMPRLIGEARAKELIMLGRRISATRAAEIGLVHEVVPPGQLRAAGDRWIADILKAAPMSIAAAKSAIERGYGRALADGLEIEAECYQHTLYTDDRDEGLAAFAEGRPPRFQGR